MDHAPLRSKNLLLGLLEKEDFACFEPHLCRVPLHAGEALAEPGDPIEQVCFPENAVVSVATVFPSGATVETGVVGICGMVGWPVLLGLREHAQRVVVQVGGGSARRMEAAAFLDVCARRPVAADFFRRFIHLFAFQLSTAVASNLADPTEKRLARWLLMCHDRLEGEEVAITHDFIGKMLGVRRATVTDALHVLEGEQAIRSRRGRVVIRDRARLEALAGEAYGTPEALYRRLIGPFGKTA